MRSFPMSLFECSCFLFRSSIVRRTREHVLDTNLSCRRERFIALARLHRRLLAVAALRTGAPRSGIGGVEGALVASAPPLGRSSIGIFVVADPPLISAGLRTTLRRVLPLFLAAERSDVEVVPSAPHLLIAAVVNKVGAKHAVAVADERICA